MAQPRLTPRQKMINMMYLVLTALLALNVSKETLDVIAKVDKSLNQTIENFVSQNNVTYADFNQANAINPSKVGPFKEKADLVKIEAQNLVDKINEYKWLIVKEADGKKATKDSIRSPEDLNNPALIMLTQKPVDYENKKICRATDLRNSITRYKEFLIAKVDVNDSVLIHSLEKALETLDIKGLKGDDSPTWEQDNFEYLPLIGVITLMSKMQSDVRNAESDILNYLFSGIDEESFKFNLLMPAVIPRTSTMVVVGNPYEAEIFLAAVDTTQDPEILINNRPIEVKDGIGIFRTVPNKAGHFKWGGIINYKAPDGRILSYEFEEEYDVIPPVLIVSPTKMNVFYESLPNPIEVNVPGSTPGSIQVDVTNATIRKGQGYEYEVMPTQDYGEAIVRVSAEFNGQRRQMPDKRFRLKRVPPPIAKVGGKNGGSIEKNTLLTNQGVTAVQDDFLFDIKYTVSRFTVVVTQKGFTADDISNSQLFTDEQKRLLSSLKRGDRFIIEDIYALGPNGKEIPLSSIIFKIQ